MDLTPAVVIWRVRKTPHNVCCVAEQLGEECFELRVLSGKDLVLAESFDEPPPLLARAEELRVQYDAARPLLRPSKPTRKKPGKATRRTARS